MDKVSIIMPTYNSEKTIKKSIDSVLNQKYHNIELLVINDGSTDNTKKIIKKNMEKDSRLIYIEMVNSGVSVARNLGISKSTGSYIAFVDSDDVIDKNMIWNLMIYAKDYSCDIVSTSYEVVTSNSTIKESTYFSEGYYDKLKLIEDIYPSLFQDPTLKDKVPITIWTKIFRASLIKDNNIYLKPNLKIGEDVLFTKTCFLHAESFFYLPDTFYYKYKYNKSSVTNNYVTDLWDNLNMSIDEMNELKNKFPNYKLESQIPYSILRNAMTAIANVSKNSKSTKNQKIDELKYIVLDRTLQQAIRHVNISNLSITRKVLTMLIKNNNATLIYYLSKLYSKRLSILE